MFVKLFRFLELFQDYDHNMKTYIGDLSEKLDKQGVQLAGWVHVRRNMGKIIFLDVRDSTGYLQAVCVPQEMKETFEQAEATRPEFVS